VVYAMGTRFCGQAFGSAFLLGTFLWRSKEKYLAVRAKPCPNNPKQRKPSHQTGNPHKNPESRRKSPLPYI
jgi:hypothetical protein